MAAALLLLPVSIAARHHSCCSTLELLCRLNLSHILQTKLIYNKSQQVYVPINYLWWFPLENFFTQTALAWSSLFTDSPNSAAFPSLLLEHRRLQAKKLRTSMINKTTQIVGSNQDIFQHWTYFPGTDAMVINPMARRIFLFDNIMYNVHIRSSACSVYVFFVRM